MFFISSQSFMLHARGAHASDAALLLLCEQEFLSLRQPFSAWFPIRCEFIEI
jgi:hypothetical protein